MDKLVILLSGKKGSGKSTISDYLEHNFSFTSIKLGGYIDKYLLDNDIELNSKNKTYFSQKFLLESGCNSLLYYFKNKFYDSATSFFVVDSIISQDDYLYFKSLNVPYVLWHVVLDDSERLTRIQQRNRSDDKDLDKLSLTEFEQSHMSDVDSLYDLAQQIFTNHSSTIQLYKSVNVQLDYLLSKKSEL